MSWCSRERYSPPKKFCKPDNWPWPCYSTSLFPRGADFLIYAQSSASQTALAGQQSLYESRAGDYGAHRTDLMGEAKVKRNRRQELLAAHPFCIYCGAPATTTDHCP